MTFWNSGTHNMFRARAQRLNPRPKGNRFPSAINCRHPACFFRPPTDGERCTRWHKQVWLKSQLTAEAFPPTAATRS